MININYLPEEPPIAPFDFMAKYFDGDWRQGKEIRQIKITHRYYQISVNETKSWFSNDSWSPESSRVLSWNRTAVQNVSLEN